MAKPIMIQGTMSNAGKSFFAAGLCRIFMQDGYKCAPFKSQNMALNSYITADGHEIGRAQAMQAEAAGAEPSVLMNPVLLKPTTDVGSQVIVNGRPFGNMTASEYFRNKKQLIPQIKNAYDKLSAENDIIVIEGAGSPVELNLLSDDIVNMGMAKIAESPVILVGDIDRGGIFPQLLGTLDLFAPDERAMVKGLVVNKFRGDISLFESGTAILEQRGGVDVLGVVPYIRCDIEDEDSLSVKLEKNKQGIVNIAVVKLPRMSNFTDFDVFSQYDGVAVQYAARYSELENADMIIIPGTKSTISDMNWLRESGMEAMIKKCAQKGTPVFGICGGFQMLGKSISDPHNTEGGGRIGGMGMLDCKTVFNKEKTQVRTNGKFNDIEGTFGFLSGSRYEGYEIHMGETMIGGNALLDKGGCVKDNVCGCYIHGIFDDEQVSEKIVKMLFEARGLQYMGGVTDRRKYKEQQFDILADAIRNSIDMAKVYDIIERGI